MTTPHAGPGLFARFLRRRRATRHYRRLSWWGHRVGGPSHQHTAQRVGATMLAAAQLDDAALLARWHSTAAGISAAQAAKVRRHVAVVAVGLWLPMGPLAPLLRLQPLPAAYFAWLPALLLGYALLVQGMKSVWQRHAAWQ